MPYSSPADLPDSVKGTLPVHAQEIYLSAYNSAFSGACKERQDKEACCASIAWAAVKRSYVKLPDGTWRPTPENHTREEADNVTDNSEQELEQFEEAILPAQLPQNFIKEDGTARIRIIKPGWGSSGYYSEQMLARDAGKVYTPGLHMYLDHPTTAEERARPERSLKDLAGVISGNVAYEKDGPAGPGVYADATIFSPYRGMLREMAPHIGVSHRAQGKSKPGTADGKTGSIIESLERAYSVDLVTVPGAGGSLIQVFESWRENGTTNTNRTEEENMTEKKITVEQVRSDPALMKELRETILREQAEGEGEGEGGMSREEELMAQIAEYKKKIAELEAELDRMKEKEAVGDAVGMATEEVAKTGLPDITKQRLIESLPRRIVVKNGQLDRESFGKVVQETIKSETEYIAKLTEAGRVRGFGGGKHTGDKNTRDALKESFRAAYLAQGFPLEEAEKRATVAAEGR